MSIYNIISEDIKENNYKNIATITVGVVSNINDPEGLGRVKVKLLNRTTSEYETDFIRVMTPMSGSGWGMFFLPEVGDEVLVAFCDGDICRPYVIGSLWNDSEDEERRRKVPITVTDGENNKRQIKTKSGHRITFNDKVEEKNGEKESVGRIRLTTSKGLMLSLEDKNETIIIKFNDKNGNKSGIKINGKEGAISIKAQQKIELVAGNSKIILDGQGNSVSIESGGELKISGNQVGIEGQSSTELKSSGQVTVQASGIANVKGSMIKLN